MRTSRKWVSIVAVGLTATLAMGCSKKKDDDDDSSSSPSPKFIAHGQIVADHEAGTCQVKPSANFDGSSFQCQTIVNGQAGEWQTCADGHTVAADPQLATQIKIKEIAKSGKESEASIAYECKVVSQGPGQQPIEGLRTEIVEKSTLPQVVTAESLVVTFAVSGAEVNLSDIRYECRRENEQAYRRCAGGDSYEFTGLQNGEAYALAVRAVHTPSETIAMEDTINFTVELPNLTVQGEEALKAQKTGTVQLMFDKNEVNASTVSCTLNPDMGGQPIDCSNGFISLNLNDSRSIPAGNNSLLIEAKTSNNEIVATKYIQFCAINCNSGGAPADQLIEQNFPIGSFYDYNIPAGLHVTQWATMKNWVNGVHFYRVTNESDPEYHYLYECNNSRRAEGGERLVTKLTPAGGEMDYCESTPNSQEFKEMFEYGYAFNHLELGTDPDVLAQDPLVHEKVLVNVFDRRREFTQSMSRFEQLCMNARGSIQKSPMIPLVRDYYNREMNFPSTWSNIYMCYSETNDFGSSEGWFVGSFFIAVGNQDLPKFECYKNPGWYVQDHDVYTQGYCGRFRNPNLLEVTYMAKSNGRNFNTFYQFARQMQERFLFRLKQRVPQ